MKRLFLLLIAVFIFYLPGRSQDQKLPAEIQQYYNIRNFINLYSRQNERDFIMILYHRGKNISYIQDPRLRRIAYLIFSTSKQYFHSVNYSSKENSFTVPQELILPMACGIKNWQQEDNNHITVTTYSYVFGPDIIHKAMNSYTPDISPSDINYKDLNENRIYRSLQIDDWTQENGQWVKYPVMKVLVE